MKEIKLTKGFVAFVSEEDFERVAAHKWYASIESRGTKVYAIRWITVAKGKRKKVRMSHFVLDYPPGTLPEDSVIDHLNHDGLDNRRENLEVVSQAENMSRSPGWKRKGCPALVTEPWL